MGFGILVILIVFNAKVVETSNLLYNNTHYSITNSNLPVDHWIKIIGSTGRYTEKKPVKTNKTPTKLTGNVCTSSNLTVCNVMREEFMCLCSLPLGSTYRPFRSCTDVLKVVNIQHYVYEIHYKLNEFAVKSEYDLLRNLNILVSINPKLVVVFRKGCGSNQKTYFFQFALLRSLNTQSPGIVRDVDLQLGHPTFFERTRLFYRQNISQIVKFKMSRFLYPIYFDHLEQKKLGCTQINDPSCSNSTICHNCTPEFFNPNHRDFWPVLIRVLLLFLIFLVIGIGYKYNTLERGVERHRARESAIEQLDFEQNKQSCITTAL